MYYNGYRGYALYCSCPSNAYWVARENQILHGTQPFASLKQNPESPKHPAFHGVARAVVTSVLDIGLQEKLSNVRRLRFG
jgi:hypothetical protein